MVLQILLDYEKERAFHMDSSTETRHTTLTQDKYFHYHLIVCIIVLPIVPSIEKLRFQDNLL